MKEVVTNKGLVYELTAVEADDILTALHVAEQKFLDKELWTFAGRMKYCIDIMENPEKEDYCKIANERIKNRIEKENEKMNIKEKVLRLAMQDVPNKLIAEVLDISENSVRNILELRKVEERINECMKEDSINDRLDSIDEMIDILESKYDTLIIKENNLKTAVNGVSEYVNCLDKTIQNLKDEVAETDCRLAKHIQSISIYFGDGKDDED